jgi:small-conductance mechanosensitive channel
MARPPLDVDWQAIRGLYLQGIPPRQLAKQFGMNESTLRSRACKEKWTHIIATAKQHKAATTEKSAAIAGDIWAERRETIRERIHLIGDRMTIAASQLSEDQLINKADKVKIATEIAGKSVGLDRDEDRNQVNIAILGSIGSSPGGYDDSRSFDSVPQAVTILPSYTVKDTDTEAVNPTSHPTTVDPDPAAPV